MEKEALKKTFDPDSGIAVSLYGYFVLVVMYAIASVDVIALLKVPILQVVHAPFLIAGYLVCLCYAMIAIVVFLRGKPSSVFTLQISILQLAMIHGVAGRHILAYRHCPVVALYIVYIFVLLYLAFLFFYVRHAKCVVDGIPKVTRHIGVVGYCGLLITLSVVMLVSWPYGRKVFYLLGHTDPLVATECEVSDGRVAFRPNADWEMVSAVAKGENIFFKTDNGDVVTVRSDVCPLFCRLSFAEEMTKSLPDSCCESRSDVRELEYMSTDVSGRSLFASTYCFKNSHSENDSGLKYWTFAILKSQHGDEVCVLSVLGQGGYCSNDAIKNFMGNVRFASEQ